LSALFNSRGNYWAGEKIEQGFVELLRVRRVDPVWAAGLEVPDSVGVNFHQGAK